jgi:hypothetical protein
MSANRQRSMTVFPACPQTRFDVDANEITREAALDLVAEFGPTIVEKTEEAIRDEPRDEPHPEHEARRSWVESLHLAVDIGHAAHFLYLVAPIMVAKWSAVRDINAVRAAGEEAAKHRGDLKPAIVATIIDAVSRRIVAQRP